LEQDIVLNYSTSDITTYSLKIRYGSSFILGYVASKLNNFMANPE